MFSRRIGTKGFTLIEIMIVVGLIGLLAAIAIPNYIASRRKACESSCINNLRQIEEAMHVWAFEAKRGPATPVTFDDIRDYLKRSVVCPSGGTTFADSYTLTTVDETPTCKLVPDTHRFESEALLAEKQGWAWGKGGNPNHSSPTP
jgi:prepilin-type N-terminal cleavage/methylation domain-containing protein